MVADDGSVRWSASDLVAAATCEFAVLRKLDAKLGRSERLEVAQDPLEKRIANLGDKHEEAILQDLRHQLGVDAVDELPRAATSSDEELHRVHARTLDAFASDATV